MREKPDSLNNPARVTFKGIFLSHFLIENLKYM